MKKTVLMSAAKKARIALAVMAVFGMSFVGAQEAFAENVTVDAKKNIICGDEAKVKKHPESAVDAFNAIVIGNSAEVGAKMSIAIGCGAKTGKMATVGNGDGNIAIGPNAHALDDATTAIGGGASATAFFTTAIGNMSRAEGSQSIAIGRGWAEKERSMAIGNYSEAKYKNSIAIGYHSIASAENTVSVGSVYEEFVGFESGTWTPIYQSVDNRRRITYVADGKDDHDAATVGQVKSMIAAGGGASFDGSKLNTAIQDVDIAGGYKDTATNPNTDTKGTIAGAINSAYQAGKDYTDTKVTAVEGKLNTLETKVDKNTSDISNIKTNIGDMSKLDINGKNNLVDAVNEAYKAATSAGANVGKLDELTTTNRDNLVGAVNEVNKKADKAQTTADNALNKANDAQTTANSALNKANANENKIGDLNSLTTTEKGNLVGAVNEVNNKVGTADELKALKDAGLGDNLAQATAAVNKKADKNAEDIKNVNGRVDELGGRVDTLGGAVAKLDSRVNKVGAGAAALAALHPMEFDSDNKLSFAAGVGNYRGTNAAAIGAFYRPSEQVMFSISGNMGNGENMVNAGVSFALDRPSKTPTTKAALVKTVVAQNEQIAALNETVAEQSREIAELKAMVQQLAAKQNA